MAIPKASGIGAIFGIVSEEGAVKEGSPVNLHIRDTGELWARQYTRADGGFVFNGLDADSDGYMVTATDEDGDPKKEALIRDRIQPVPAHMGSTWPNNWQRLALTKGAASGWLGATSKAGEPVSLNGSLAVAYGTHVKATGSITPAASVIPALHVKNSSVHFAPEGDLKNLNTLQGPAKLSLEVVFDTRSTRKKVCFSATYGNTDQKLNFQYYKRKVDAYFNLAYPTLFIEYDPASRTLSVSASADSYDLVQSIGYFKYNLLKTASGVVPANKGLIHVIASCTYGEMLRVYVDGVEFVAESLAGLASRPVYKTHTYVAYVSLFGTDDTGVSAASATPLDTVVGPMAYYPYTALTQADATRHYAALTDQTVLPLASGYAREVMTDMPLLYLRLNGADDNTVGMDALRPEETARRALVAGNLTYSASTPVVGGSGVTFNGGALRWEAQTCGVPAAGFSVDLFVKPATNTGDVTLLRLPCPDEPKRNNNEMDEKSCHITLNGESRKLSIAFDSGGATQTVAFGHALTLDTWQHIGISIDRPAGRAVLFIDGGQVEEVTTPKTALDHNMQQVYFGVPHTVTAGGEVNSGGTTGLRNTFRGSLSEIALFPSVLSASRFKAHFDARLVP